MEANLIKTFALVLVLMYLGSYCYSSKPRSFVENVSDIKEWKKILRTRTNILALYTKGKLKSEISNVFDEVSREMRGTATLIHVDCSGEGKKLCKKNKAEPNTYTIKHYKDGDYHKDYDRRESVSSMITFLRDPSGDLPWDEDPIGDDVVHINDVAGLNRILRKERSFMLMFYAPWCGFCKRLKPDYSMAASELRRTHVLAAMDVNKPENTESRIKYNVTGFPTLIYFESGRPKYLYEGENNKNGIVNFMRNPAPAKEKPKEEVWSDVPSEILHLTDKTFHDVLKKHNSVIVMFYAPWCGHCKKMKPEYTLAAAILKDMGINGNLAAVDATKEKSISIEFGIKGYPTLKYFKNGNFAFDVSHLRDKDQLVSFLQEPKEPPPPPPTEKPWAETTSSVHHLTDDTFKSFLKKKKHVLVMFYAPWCGHCKKAKPEFTAAADYFSDDPKVEFAAVDCTEHDQACRLNDIRGYPTFHYFNYFKHAKPYNGGRLQSDFVSFMMDPDNAVTPRPPSLNPSDPNAEWGHVEGSQFLVHLSDSTFDSFVQDKTVLVLFYAPWCGHCKSMKVDYASAASKLDELGVSGRLACVDSTVERTLSSRYQIQGFPTLKLFKNGLEVAEYEGPRKMEDFVMFVKDSCESGEDINDVEESTDENIKKLEL